MRKIILLVLAAVLAACFLPSCSGENESAETSDLYLLEELETARAVEDADKRIERLDIIAGLQPDHP